MPVVYHENKIPHIGDEIVSVRINAFCNIDFQSGLSLQLEIDNSKYAFLHDVVTGYNITENLKTEGCLQIELTDTLSNTTRFVTVYVQAWDGFYQNMMDRMIQNNREINLDKLLWK